MTPMLAFVITGGCYGLAAILALLGDGLDRGRIASLVASGLLVAGGAVGLTVAWGASATVVFDTFRVGAGFSLIPGLAGVLGGLAVLSASRAPRNAGQRAALLAMAVLGASLAAQAGDLVTLVLALEIAAASSYAIVALSRTRRAFEAAIKYFVQGAVATALLLLAVAVFAGGVEPRAEYGEISRALGSVPSSGLVFGMVVLVAGLAFKAGAAPFHSWAPDAYELAPPAGSAVLAGVVKAAAVAALSAVVIAAAGVGRAESDPATVLGSELFLLLGALSVLSVVVGSVAALRQRSYTRMLGYAGVAQVGYAMMALAALSPASALAAISTYAVATTGAFVAAEAVLTIDPDWDGTVGGLAGLARRSPALAFGMSLTMLSMAGIPPLIGFWGKLQVFQVTIARSAGLASQGSAELALWFAFLSLVGVVGAVVSIAYYGAVVRTVYAQGDVSIGTEQTTPSAALVVTLAVGAATVGLGLVPVFANADAIIRGFRM